MFRRAVRFCFCVAMTPILAAFFAARERLAALRRFAARRAWRDNARCEAARWGARFNLRFPARERAREGRLWLPPFFNSRRACFFVLREPRFGGGSFTPARRALDKPIAIACFAEAAPCFPSRICSISSRTNSPAWVEGDFPSRLSSRARSIVSSSGIVQMFAPNIESGCAMRLSSARNSTFSLDE